MLERLSKTETIASKATADAHSAPAEPSAPHQKERGNAKDGECCQCAIRISHRRVVSAGRRVLDSFKLCHALLGNEMRLFTSYSCSYTSAHVLTANSWPK